MNPESQPVHKAGDTFELYDLAVIVESIQGNCTCMMEVGDRFYLRSGKILMPDGADFCLYALQSTIPLLPAKQRKNHPADWMETDSRVVCPDPACQLTMRIDRVCTRTLHHDDVSAVPLQTDDPLPADPLPAQDDAQHDPTDETPQNED